MKLCSFLLLILLLSFCLGNGSNENCEEVTELLRKLCSRYPGHWRNSCLKRRLKESHCTSSCDNNCQNGDNNDCNYRNDECREETKLNSTQTQNIRTDVNVHNVINNHNKIKQQVAVKSSLVNYVVLNQTRRENQLLCCQILVPKCNNVVKNVCTWEIQERCGEMCKYPAYRSVIAPYEPYQRFFYNYHPKRCISRWPYVNCNFYDCQYCYYSHCQQYQWCKDVFSWYYNYYTYYNWWKVYNEYLNKKNDADSTDHESATVNSIGEEADSTEVNEDDNDDEML